MNWRQFKPTIFFLVRFLALYLLGNLVYNVSVSSYEPQPDPITINVTQQTAWILQHTGWPTTTLHVYKLHPNVGLLLSGRPIVAVFEGCNGINVMIVFVSFLLAFGPYKKPLRWFLPLGLVIIHVFNLGRVALLFLVSLYTPHVLYFAHKYLFTASIYGVVLVLWLIWVRFFSRNTNLPADV